MKKILSLVTICTILLAGCSTSTTNVGAISTEKQVKDAKAKQVAVSAKLETSQPTPTDLDYSLERYNLIKRAYWVNGNREKANAMQSEVPLPLGHIALISQGAVVAEFDVEGKVSSLESYLTPEYYNDLNYGDSVQTPLADTDGSYGQNAKGVFFFTTDGNYVEWSGEYLYTDAYFEATPVIEVAHNE